MILRIGDLKAPSCILNSNLFDSPEAMGVPLGYLLGFLPPASVWHILSRDQGWGALGQKSERTENKESRSVWSVEIYSMKPRVIQYQEVYHMLIDYVSTPSTNERKSN